MTRNTKNTSTQASLRDEHENIAPTNTQVSAVSDASIASVEEVSDKVFTIPNIISFARLCLVPLYLVLLLSGQDLAATLTFAFAASTDWIDGQVARRTHSVSKLGQLLDPAVDRILMIAGVLGLLLVGRLPLWIIIVVVARDLFLMLGALWLLKCHNIRIAVIYAGKFATTFLFVGFVGLLLNFPQIPGLGICDIQWLPGFTSVSVSWGIWFVYAGLILAIITTLYYLCAAIKKLKEAQNESRIDGEAKGAHAEVQRNGEAKGAHAEVQRNGEAKGAHAEVQTNTEQEIDSK